MDLGCVNYEKYDDVGGAAARKPWNRICSSSIPIFYFRYQAFASYTILNAVWVARLKCINPPVLTTLEFGAQPNINLGAARWHRPSIVAASFHLLDLVVLPAKKLSSIFITKSGCKWYDRYCTLLPYSHLGRSYQKPQGWALKASLYFSFLHPYSFE